MLFCKTSVMHTLVSLDNISCYKVLKQGAYFNWPVSVLGCDTLTILSMYET